MALTGLTNLQPLHIKTVGIGTFDNTVSIGGTLTYQDVTNIDSIGIVTARDDINIITDGKKLNIGASADLQLHHTANHSYVDDAGAGNLRLRSGTLEIQNLASSKTSAIFSSGGGQTLNFNNSTKFVTTNTGVVITGICTATSFKGDGSNLTGITQTTINSNADNRIITGSGTANTLNAETNLTFDGHDLDITRSNSSMRLTVSSNVPKINFNANGVSDAARITIEESGGGGLMKLATKPSGGSLTERVRIQSDGKIGIGRNDPVNFVDIARGQDEENILVVRGADNTSEYGAIGISGSHYYITGGGAGSTSTGIMFRTAASGNETNRLEITSSGHVEPATDNTYNFGSLTKRWANIYSADLNLSNEGSKNDVDGTWGNYTIQEGQDDLFLINKRNGKKYMFVLKEVS